MTTTTPVTAEDIAWLKEIRSNWESQADNPARPKHTARIDRLLSAIALLDAGAKDAAKAIKLVQQAIDQADALVCAVKDGHAVYPDPDTIIQPLQNVLAILSRLPAQGDKMVEIAKAKTDEPIHSYGECENPFECSVCAEMRGDENFDGERP